MPEIYNYESNTLVSGTDKLDYIYNSGGKYVTVQGLGGNDSIYNLSRTITEWDDDAGYVTVTITSDNTTIEGGDGNDYVENNASVVAIYGGAGNDSIDNSGENVTIDGGAGSDSVENTADNVTIDAGASNDYIFNGNSNVKGGSNVKISGKAGKDSIISSGDNVTIDGGTGDDSISNFGANVLFNYASGDGNDTIEGFNETSTLSISGGDYSILRTTKDIVVTVGKNKINLLDAGQSVNINGTNYKVAISLSSGGEYFSNTLAQETILGGDGKDTISNSAENVSINAGGGANSIENYGKNVSIVSGAGDDQIYNRLTSSAWDKEKGSYVIAVGPDNTTIESGAGEDSIANHGSNVTIDTGSGIDYVENLGSNVIINSGDDDDYIFNGYYYDMYNENVTINTGAGNDSVENYISPKNLINTGAGKDYIYNGSHDEYNNHWRGGDSITIDAGDDDDYIYSYASQVSIVGGAGNDTIYNDGKSATIDGGAGNNFINNSEDDILFVYGGGNDTIEGFKGNSTLSISGGDYSIFRDTANVIVTVGDGKITLLGTSSLGSINVNGINQELLTVNLNDDGEYFKNDTSQETVIGGVGNDTVINSADNVLINGDAGDDSIYNGGYYDESGQWNDGDGGKNVSINGGAGNDYIFNSRGNNAKLFGGDGDDYITSQMSTNVTISGDAGNDSISGGQSAYSTIDGGAGDDYINFGYDVSNLSIDGGTGNDTIYIGDDENFISTTKDVTINGGAGNDYTKLLTYADNILINYTEGDGNDTIVGFNDTSRLQIGDGTGTYSIESDGDDIIVTVGKEKITLEGAYNLTKININDTEIYNYKWTIDGTTATYGKENQILVEVNGVTSTNGISIDGNVVTVSKAALGTDNVTISDGYTLKLADDVAIPASTEKWSYDNSTATLKRTTTEGYELSEDGGTISYYPERTDTLLTVSGVKSLNGISINDTTVTVSKKSLGTNTVTISDGYTLKLADDVAIPVSTEKWSHSKTTATLKKTTTAGYQLSEDGKSISYYPKKIDTLLTVKGVTSADGLELNDTVVKVPVAVLNEKKVTISDGYSLALAKDVPLSSTVENWKYSNAVATYRKIITPGYTLSEDESSITYSKNEDDITVNVKGVKSKNGLSIDGTTVTVANSALNKKTVTIDKGYSLALADNVAKSKTTKSWSYSNSTATLKRTISTGYSLADDESSIAYYKQGTATLATIKGAKKTSGLTADDNVITLKNAALNKKVTISGSYEFDFAADYKKASIVASGNEDTITTRGDNISVNGGAGNDVIKILGASTSINGGTGNDSITSNGAGNIFVYAAGDGNDVITNYAEEDKIKITSGKVSKKTTKGNDVILTIGDGKITVKNAKGKLVTYITENGIEYTYPESVKFNSKITSATLLNTFTKNTFNVADYGSLLNTVNASAVTHNINITGNKEANKIIGSSQDDLIDGGAGADTLDGGAGNDSIFGGAGNDSIFGGAGNDSLTGGAGADVFVYSSGDGNDLITDYKEEDKIQFLSGTPKISTKKDDVIFTVGSGKITVAGGKDKIITYVDSKGVEYTFPKVVEFNKSGTTVKVLANYNKDSFNVADYEDGDAVKTINASLVKHDLNITANKLANKITGTSEDDKIDGGAGKDTILGGDGNDKIDGGAGNDSISGGAGNDNLTGGDGSDIFVYSEGDGNDTITDYAEDDKIRFLTGTAKATTKKNDVIFTVGSGKITVKGGKNKIITCIDSKGVEYTYPKILTYNEDNTSVKILAAYNKNSFNMVNYGDELYTVNASAVKHDISITGNKEANKITGSSQDDLIDGAGGTDTLEGGKGNDTLIGGKGNDKLYGGKGADSLWGGAGNDTLFGGDDADIFVFNGEGKDVIADFAEIDTIMVLNGKVGDYSARKGNVTFEVGNGSIVVQGGADKYIELVNGSGNRISHYSPKLS